MPVTKIASRWASGNLIFHEAGNYGAIANLLTISPSEITVGSATQDVDLKIFLGSATEYVLFDVGNSKVDFGADGKGVNLKLFGETASAYMEWNQAADRLNMALSSIGFTGELPAQGLDRGYVTVGTNTTPISITAFAGHVVGHYTRFQLEADGAYTVLGAYHKVQTDGSTAVANAQLVGVAPRVTLDTQVDTAYGLQSHLVHTGTGNVNEAMAVSAYINTAGNYTATGRVTALQAMIEGTSTITGSVFVIYAVNGGTFTDCNSIIKIYNQSAAATDNMLLLDNDGAAAEGIVLEGAMTQGLKMSGVTLTQGSANHFVEIGTYASAMSFAMTDHVFASVTNLKVTNDGASSKWVICDYSKVEIDAANSQPNNNVAVYRPKMLLETGIENAWGMQMDINCTGTWATNDLIGVGVFLDLGTGTITSTPGKVAAMQADVYGAGTAGVTGNCYAGLFRGRGNITGVIDAVVQIENQNGVVNAAIGFDMNGGCTQAFLFNGSGCDAWTSGDAAVAQANEYVLIPVKVEGVTPQLYLQAAETWA